MRVSKGVRVVVTNSLEYEYIILPGARYNIGETALVDLDDIPGFFGKIKTVEIVDVEVAPP